MPPLYNAYGAAGVLRSKFYKDKQNWTSETDIVKAWSIWNCLYSNSPSTRNNDQNFVILRSQSGDPLTSNFDYINLEFHSEIPSSDLF
jgi:hypothetical protein